MCGRATLTCDVEEIAEVFGVSPIPVGPPRFNIAPGQDVAVIRNARPSSTSQGGGGRELALVRWGLVPWWAKDTKVSGKTLQARAETVEKAPAFRDAFAKNRCLFVVDGFYEWSGKGKARQPHHVRLASGSPFAIAAIWDSWNGPDGARLETCAVVTTSSRGPIERLHDRMPLVLDADARDRWLSTSTADARAALDSAASLELVVIPVSTWVNDVRHDEPRCLEPPDEAQPPAQATLRF